MGVEAYGYHGVFPAEKRQGQKFVVDVVVWTDFRRAAETDDLRHTVSYAELADLVVRMVAGPVEAPRGEDRPGEPGRADARQPKTGPEETRADGSGRSARGSAVGSADAGSAPTMGTGPASGTGPAMSTEPASGAGPAVGYELIETLASRIADTILEGYPVHAVEVTVHKPQAPIPHPFADVRVVARRSARAGQ